MTEWNVTKNGLSRLRRWQLMTNEAEKLRARLRNVEAEVIFAERELALWILPVDATAGETIAVWFGDSLVQATAYQLKDGRWSGPVAWRLKGPKWSELFR